MLAIAARTRPLAVGALIIAASVVMRFGFIDSGYADQIQVSQSAFERVLAGGNPYGVGYASTLGAPFPYGPLALVWWLPGPVIEGVAVTALMALLLWQRAWLTLAVIAGWHPAVYLTFVGVNDYSPALLIALGLVLLRTRPVWGGVTLAAAAALKPYAAAWFLPAIGFGGLATALSVLGASVLLWSPLLLVWGIPSFLRTVELANAVHDEAGYTLNLPMLRWLAIPFAALGLAARRWEHAVIFGSAAFIVFLFLDRWASYGYWIAVIPPLGLALEALWRGRARDRSGIRQRVDVAPAPLVGRLDAAPLGPLVEGDDEVPVLARRHHVGDIGLPGR